MFADREDTGRRLADLSDGRDETADFMLAIPWGGLPVGRKIVDHLRTPLDVVVASKVGIPGNPELAVGAVAGNGSAWWSEDLSSYLNAGEDYLSREREHEATTAEDKVSLYHGGDPLPDIAEGRAVIVDSGVVIGATTRVCLWQIIAGDAERVVLVIPAGPPNTPLELEAECNAVITVGSPKASGVVDTLYRDFTQVSDEETMTYLRGGAGKHWGKLLTAKAHRRAVAPNLGSRMD